MKTQLTGREASFVHRFTKTGLHLCSQLAACTLAVQSAHASGFAITAQGTNQLANAFAAQAAADDPSTVWYNPAGMLGLDGTRASIVANTIRPSFKFQDTGSSGLFAAPAGNGGDAGGTALVPQVYAVRSLGDQWRVGLAINPPFGLKTEYDAGWRGQFLALKSEVKSYNVNPSVAYKVSPLLWIGAGVSWQKFIADLTNYAGPAGVAELQASDTSWGYNLGAMLRFQGGVRVGLAYRSHIAYRLDGDATFSLGQGALDSGAQARLTVPESLSASAFMPVGRNWELMANTTWTRWSRVEDLTVVRTSGSALGPAGSVVTTLPFDWKDAFFVAVGASYKMRDNWKIKFGMARDPRVSNDQTRTPRLPDQDRTLFTVGSALQLTRSDTLEIAYGHELVSDAVVNNSVPGVGVLSGRYDSSADVLSLQYTRRM